MKKVTITSDTVKPLQPSYVNDVDVVLNNKTFQSKEGIELTINESLSSPQDSVLSNYSALTLTNKQSLDSIGYIKTNKTSNYPEKFTTYLAGNIIDTARGIESNTIFIAVSADALGESQSLVTQSTLLSNPVSLSGNNENYYDIELIDENTCNISHFDNYKTMYLTYNNVNDLLFFNTATGSNTTFNYLLDREYEYIVLYKPDASNGPAVIKYVPTSNGLNILKGVAPTKNAPLPETHTPLKIRIRPSQNKHITLVNDWISYDSTSIYEDNLNIDPSKSYSNIKNNYLINSEYESTSGITLPYNFTPLKNQLTGEHNQSRYNPFLQNIPVDLRDYEKIFTGISQIEGDDKISLGYQTWTKGLTFKPGKVTLFHLPQDIYPYNRITLEDSGLIESGAIAGDTPLRSDKIFKKKSNYKSSSNYGDPSGEDRGTFLCSWLMTRPSLSSTMWVDRYFDASRLSYFQAITAPTNNTYVSEFENTYDAAVSSSDVNLDTSAVFDYTPSELTLEPGSLYAYHRIGDSDSDNIINSIPGLVQQGLHTYTDSAGNTIIPTEINNTKEYSFNRDNLGTTTVPVDNNRGSNFTISYDMYSDDWSKPFGYEILGNYNTTGGFGIFNKMAVTPFMIIPDVDNTYIFNSDFKLLGTIPVSGLKIGWSDTLDKFYIVQYDKLLAYDFKGNKLDEISSDFTDEIKDIHITRDNPIGNIVTSSRGNDLNYYNYRTGKKFKQYRGMSTAPSENDEMLVSNVSSGSLQFISSRSNTVDIYGKAHFLPYHGTHSAATLDIDTSLLYTSITSNNIINAVRSDIYGDLWFLHDDYTHITKTTNQREVLFTKPISSISPVLSSISSADHKHMDFIREFSDTGLDEYFILLNQNFTSTLSSDTTCYYFNMSGFYIKSNKVEANIIRGLASIYSYGNYWATDGKGLHDLDSVNNYDFLKTYYHSETYSNSLKFKTKLINPVDKTDYDIIEFNIDVHDFSPGKNNFTYVCDNTTSTYTLYVNSIIYDTINLTNEATDGTGVPTVENKYRFDNTINRSFMIGSAPYYDGIPLQTGLFQSNYYLGNNFKLSNINIINDNLNYFDSKYLYRATKHIESLEWNIPAGSRNYIDVIDRFYKHRLPGFKSNNYNVHTITSTITSGSIISAYEYNIKNNIKSYTPINKDVLKSTWIY
jgi:hypothetical protein